MTLKVFTLSSALALLVTVTACEKSSPTRPSDVGSASPEAASVTDASTGITVIAPSPVSPADGVDVKYSAQPVTIVIKNAVTTGSATLTYTFEVATDTGFANKVVNRTGIAQGGGGQTSLTLDTLAGATRYYWRARAAAGAVNTPYSLVRTINIGQQVILQPPVLSAPTQNSTVGSVTLVINNVVRSGPAGPIAYRFDLSDSSNFGNTLFTTTVAEGGGGQTSVKVTSPLTSGNTYFWRAMASDSSNAVTTPFSGVFSFKYIVFDMRQAVIMDNPRDLGSWEETTNITSVEFHRDAMLVEFDKRLAGNGRGFPGRWPDVTPPGWDGAIQYTLGSCLNITAKWYCSAVVQFWFDRPLTDSGIPGDFWFEWWYNPVRWGPMTFYRAAVGEPFGVFVAAGDLRGRDFSKESCPAVCERSDVVIMPFHDQYRR